MTQEQLDSEKPIKHPNDKGLPPGAQSVRVAGDDVTYDESELFGALSDSDEDGEGRESGLGNKNFEISFQVYWIENILKTLKDIIQVSIQSFDFRLLSRKCRAKQNRC